MSFITAALIVGGAAVAGAGISAYAGSRQAGAARDAANTQATAANYAADLQMQQYQQTRTDMMPWLTAGTGAVNQLSAGMAPGGQFSSYQRFSAPTLTDDPGYWWRMREGVNALDASAAMMGNPGSGNLGTALVRFGQDYGSQEYGQTYNRAFNEYLTGYNQWQDTYNRLAGLAGTGQIAAQNLGQTGLLSAANRGEFATQGANALAAGGMGSAFYSGQGLVGGMNSLQSGLGSYMNWQQNQQYLNMLNQRYADYNPSNYMPMMGSPQDFISGANSMYLSEAYAPYGF